MGTRRTLSILAKRATIRRASHASTVESITYDHDIQINGLKDLAVTNLQRHPSIRVSFH
jgi:hypothetical protein